MSEDENFHYQLKTLAFKESEKGNKRNSFI